MELNIPNKIVGLTSKRRKKSILKLKILNLLYLMNYI